MNSVFKIADYQTSRDYEALADMMQQQSLICIVDHLNTRDVAQTIWSPTPKGDGMWIISARGISYITALSRASFIAECERLHVEVLMPKTISNISSAAAIAACACN